jgi:hypothetical protein
VNKASTKKESYMKNILFCSVVLIAGLGSLTGCSSPEENRERKENAFDLSGTYKTTQKSATQMNFEIINEQGRYDIYAKVNRSSPLSKQEVSFLNTQKVDLDFVNKYLSQTLIIGKGYDKDDPDGENNSTDFGESSKFGICSPQYRFDKDTTLDFCLDGRIVKKTHSMTGHFSMNVTHHRVEQHDGKPTDVYEISTHNENFQVDTDAVFYRQYQGTWNGEVYSLISNFDFSAFNHVALRIDEATRTFVCTPALPKITYKGEIYNFNVTANTFDISQIADPIYPALQIIFEGPQGKRIVLFGQIWSLGTFTGSITYVDGSQQLDLGTFRFKKL